MNKVKHADGSKTINGYTVLHELGEGSFGEVRLCKHEASGQHFALKIFRKGRLLRMREYFGGDGGGKMKVKTALEKVYSELAVLRRVDHPNCVKLFAVFEDDDKEGKLYMLLEFMALGATMEWDAATIAYVSRATGGVLPEDTAAACVRDALQGLQFLHGALIAHRDIKPQNLLVSDRGVLKISDFGVSICMREDHRVFGTEGTYHFYSPEMCLAEGYAGHDGRKADLWALGVSLWAFLFGSVPFFSADLVHLMEAIEEAKYELPTAPVLSGACRACLCRLLLRDPSERPLAEALLEDTWIDGAPPIVVQAPVGAAAVSATTTRTFTPPSPRVTAVASER